MSRIQGQHGSPIGGIMTLQDYLEHCSTTPVPDTIESDWLDFCSLSVKSGKLAIFDPTLFDGPIVLLSPADYQISVKVTTEGQIKRASRLRVASRADGALGPKIAEVCVDFAQVGVGDADAIYAAVKGASESDQQEIMSAMGTLSLFGIIPWSRSEGVFMPWVVSGDGDGCYPVLELVLNGDRVGVEVIFLRYADELRHIYASRFEADFPAFARFVASGRSDPLGEIGSPLSEEEIMQEEACLGVPLPPSYRRCLSIARSISIQGGAMRFETGHPFWYDFGPLDNLPQRERDAVLSGGEGKWPPQSQGMLCFAEFCLAGDGDQVLFDVKGGMIDGEYPVWYWDHERPAAHQIAEGFRDWLERVVPGRADGKSQTHMD